jgi:ankyrin repeat protein
MTTHLEHYMNYNSIPLSKRIEKSTQSTNRNVNYELKGRDINWRSGINTVDSETGLTPLMVAIIQGKKDIAVALIERGAEVEVIDGKKGRTPLAFAAKEGQSDLVKELLKRDALVNSTDSYKKTPLMHASKAGYLDCVEILLARGAGVNMIDENGYTSLHYASKFGHQAVVSSLIKAAASVEFRDNNDGYAAIHFAAQFGRKETLVTLIEAGARINRRTIKEKLTPLMLAAREGNKSIVSLLITKGAEVNSIDIHGWTALHFTASWGRRDTAHILIVEGQAHLNACYPTADGLGGTTPLIVAAKGAQLAIIKLLLHYGADINQSEQLTGQNALASAAEIGHSHVLSLLLSYSASINYQNPFTGTTSLMTAITAGKRGAIITLLNYYADINIIDFKYKTAFDYADEYETRDILLSAILNISSSAKTNLLPWFELHIPLLIRGSSYGGPSVFLNSLLYGNKGLFYGLYNATRDRDVYLIYSLIILIISAKQSSFSNPRDKPDLLEKIRILEEMICIIMKSREMVDDYIFTDCFILGSLPVKQLITEINEKKMITIAESKSNRTRAVTEEEDEDDDDLVVKRGSEFQESKEHLSRLAKKKNINNNNNKKKEKKTKNTSIFDMKYFLSSFFFGPLALYLDNNLTSLLSCTILREKIDYSFETFLKSPSFIIDGYGYESSFLLWRYNAMMMFILEGISHLILLITILIYAFNDHPSSLSGASSSSSLSSLSSTETFLLIMTISFFFYQVGLIEEKRWSVSPSVIFDYYSLEVTRYKKIISHFFESPWNFLDLCTTSLLSSWFGIRLYLLYSASSSSSSTSSSSSSISYYQSVSSELLLITIIPLSFGLLRYFSIFYQPFDREILAICCYICNLSIYFLLFLISILSFSIVYYVIYHNSVNEFSSFSKTLENIFNMIFLNYDFNTFDSSSSSSSLTSSNSTSMILSSHNSSFGITLTVFFIIFTVFLLFNGMIGNISSNYSKNLILADEWSGQIKAKLIQRYSPILEKSPLCMLPPPLTIISLIAYPFHTYIIWRARLALQQRTVISFAGTLSDIVLGLIILLPCAIYEYILIDIIRGRRGGFLYSLLYSPFGIAYICFCLLWKMKKEENIQVILKSRISDGRVRISYSMKQDYLLEGEQSLSYFEEKRIFKDLQMFSSANHNPFSFLFDFRNNKEIEEQGRKEYDEIKGIIGARYQHQQQQQPKEGKDEEEAKEVSKYTTNNNISVSKVTIPMFEEGKEEPDQQTKTYFDSFWKTFFQKRFNDPIAGRNVRIAPHNNPYLQLNNISNLEEVLSANDLQKKPSSSFQQELVNIQRFNEKKRKELLDKKLLLAEDIHSVYKASLDNGLGSAAAPEPEEEDRADQDEEDMENNEEFDDLYHILQENNEKPDIFWSKEDKQEEEEETYFSDNKKQKKAGFNPFQPGILKKDQWNELANEKEPKNSTVSLTFSKPIASSMLSRPSSQQEMISSRKSSNLFPTTIKESHKIIKSSNYINHHLNDNEHQQQHQQQQHQQPQQHSSMIDEQGIDHFKLINFPSFYFHLSKFQPIFYENERKDIFSKVLKDLFIDDFAYQIECNEKYLLELRETIHSLKKVNQEQTSVIKKLVKKLNNPFVQQQQLHDSYNYQSNEGSYLHAAIHSDENGFDSYPATAGGDSTYY